MAARATVSFLRANGLSLTLAAIFLACLGGQWLSGWIVWNEELVRQGQDPLTLWVYASSGHFVSATFENWESEFLQIACTCC